MTASTATTTTGKAVYVRWGTNRNRSDDIAAGLGYELVSVGWKLPFGWLRPLRPLVLFWKTLRILRKLRPSVIMSHHTQPFGSVACVWYGRRHRVPVATDCHNGPFIDPLWQRFPFRQGNRYALGRATVNLVHNAPFLRFVEEHSEYKGRYAILHNKIPPVAARVERVSLGERPVVFVVFSWSIDEPVGELLQAARLCPDFEFRVTGRVRTAMLEGHGEVPKNITFLGFVSDEDFDKNMRSAQTNLVLSTRDHVLTQACHEVVGCESPLVTSDTATARSYLRRGTVFVGNVGASIAAGVQEAIRDCERLRQEMAELKPELDAEWNAQADALREIVEEAQARERQ